MPYPKRGVNQFNEKEKCIQCQAHLLGENMAITENDYLQIFKGEQAYLLLKSDSHFHLVRVDASLSESKMNRLLRIYPCSDDQLRDLGLHYSAFKAENLRGVVIKGYSAGDEIELWIGNTAKCTLGSDYTEETLSTFFDGYTITRSLPSQWTGLDPKYIRIISWTLNIVSLICSLFFCILQTPYKLWSVLCILCPITAVALRLLFPASFTLEDESMEKKIGVFRKSRRKGNLLIPSVIVPGMALSIRSLTDFTFSDSTVIILLVAASIISVVAVLLYGILNDGFRNGLVNALGILFGAVLVCLGVAGQLNYLLDFNEPETYVLEVSDKQVDRGHKSTSYYCTVTMPNGEILEVNMSASTYRSIEVGEDISVTYHKGAFGIPFYTVEDR